MTRRPPRHAPAGRAGLTLAAFGFLLLALAAGTAVALLVFSAAQPARPFGFYVAIALVSAMAWIVGHLAILLRRRRGRWEFAARLPVEARRRRPPDAGIGVAGRATALDASAIEAARTARASGATWPEICRVLHADWDRLDAVEQRLFERAITAAVDARPVRES